MKKEWSYDGENPTYEELAELLKKYNITDSKKLVNTLKENSTKGKDEYEHNCLADEKFTTLHGVPDCRRFFEIFNKCFAQEYSNNKTQFLKYVYEIYLNECEGMNNQTKPLSFDAVSNYLSCKMCAVKENGEYTRIKNDLFLNVLCNYLSKKFCRDTLFGKRYTTVKDFIAAIVPIDKENFAPEGKEVLEKDEQDKLYEIVHGPRDILKRKLLDLRNLAGSDAYKLKLALYAFNRKLDQEALHIIQPLENKSTYANNLEYLHLRAKLLSNIDRDNEAIAILEYARSIQHDSIAKETLNLLSASIKREAFKAFEEDSENIEDVKISILEKKLIDAKEISHSIFQLDNNYYPAINYIYLDVMLAFKYNDIKNLLETRAKAKKIWQEINIEINDWYSFISNTEFLIIMGEYDEALKSIRSYIDNLNEDEISDFSIFSTIRQLKIYQILCTDKELKEIISSLEKIEKDNQQSLFHLKDEH